PGDARNSHRIGDGGAPQHRIVGELRARNRKSESAVICRARAEDAVLRIAGVVVRFSARLPLRNAGDRGIGSDSEPGAARAHAADRRSGARTARAAESEAPVVAP